MPKSFKVSVAGGISAVVDTAFSDGKHVAYMENLDVRGGKAVPYQMPLLNPNITVPADSVQVFSYRQRLLFSAARRSYAAEYEDNRERIYWTEYGGNPMKMIDGTIVPLGTVRPDVPPGVYAGTDVSPQNIMATVSTGGSLAKGTEVTFRLAYQTAFGVLPPSGIVQPTISTDGSLVTLSWNNPVMDTPATQILLFMGVVGGDEKLLATLMPRVTSYSYPNALTASGELASDYDQSVSYEYCTTYTRNVNGVVDESGPSSPSPSVLAKSSRKVTVSPWAEGILQSDNTITWTVPFNLRSVTGLLGYSSDGGATNTIGVESIALETGTNRVLVTFASNHNFYNGQHIFFTGLSPNPFSDTVTTLAGSFVTGTTYTILSVGTTNFVAIGASSNTAGVVFTATGPGYGTGTATYTQNTPAEIQIVSPSIADLAPAPMLNTCYLLMGEDFVCPGSGLSGVNAYAVPQVGIASFNYNAQAGTIAMQTAVPNSFNNEKVLFTGFTDTGWNSQLIQALGDPNNVNQFFVDGKSIPSDTNFSVLAAYLVAGATYQIVSAGTTDFTTVGAANSNVGTFFVATGAGSGSGLATSHFASLAVTAIVLATGGASTTGTTTASATVANTDYMICSIGTTDFTAIGAPSNTVGTTFYATGAGSGTGTVTPCPIIGDVIYFDMVVNSITLQEAHTVLATPSNAFLLNASISGVTGSLGTTYQPGVGGVSTTALQFVPFNDYLVYRNIYRAGGTTSFQLCKQLTMDELTFLDVIPDQGLGAVLPTLFTYNGVDVVYEPAQFGLSGLCQHNSMGFAFDPGSNRVVWTPLNNMDAWVPEFYKDFDYRVLALASFNQALCVFCESGVYRADGSDPTNLIWSPTKAAPCRAGGSVQMLNNRILYLSDQGIMRFNGQESECLTDLQIPGDFWLANSRYLGTSDPGQFLVPPLQNAAYERLRGADLPGVTPRDLMPYMVSRFTQQDGLRSFIKYGKYYLYWGGDYPEFAAQTMLCIDFGAPGYPITVIGVKPMDAFVDELERVHMILNCPLFVQGPIDGGAPDTTVWGEPLDAGTPGVNFRGNLLDLGGVS